MCVLLYGSLTGDSSRNLIFNNKTTEMGRPGDNHVEESTETTTMTERIVTKEEFQEAMAIVEAWYKQQAKTIVPVQETDEEEPEDAWKVE